MDFKTANPQDESYWFVKDEDGQPTVVLIEYIYKVERETKETTISAYKASYVGVQGSFDATELEYIGLAFPVTQSMIEKIKQIKQHVSEEDLLSGKHFQNTINHTLETAARYKNTLHVSVGDADYIPTDEQMKNMEKLFKNSDPGQIEIVTNAINKE